MTQCSRPPASGLCNGQPSDCAAVQQYSGMAEERLNITEDEVCLRTVCWAHSWLVMVWPSTERSKFTCCNKAIKRKTIPLLNHCRSLLQLRQSLMFVELSDLFVQVCFLCAVVVVKPHWRSRSRSVSCSNLQSDHTQMSSTKNLRLWGRVISDVQIEMGKCKQINSVSKHAEGVEERTAALSRDYWHGSRIIRCKHSPARLQEDVCLVN